MLNSLIKYAYSFEIRSIDSNHREYLSKKYVNTVNLFVHYYQIVRKSKNENG